MPEVRLVGPAGEQVGIVAIGEALKLAQDSDLDLVEVAPMARPPVCKLMDYGKFKYEAAQKARESRKNQVLTVIKEMKLRPKIDPHDYATKKGHVVRFLKTGDKVKITIMFRGREQSRPELGFRLLQRLAEDVGELGFVEAAPKQDGRNMIMVLAPHKNAADLKKAAVEPRPSAAQRSAPEQPAEADREPALAAAGSRDSASAPSAPSPDLRLSPSAADSAERDVRAAAAPTPAAGPSGPSRVSAPSAPPTPPGPAPTPPSSAPAPLLSPDAGSLPKAVPSKPAPRAPAAGSASPSTVASAPRPTGAAAPKPTKPPVRPAAPASSAGARPRPTPPAPSPAPAPAPSQDTSPASA